jgi:hypothetical protein
MGHGGPMCVCYCTYVVLLGHGHVARGMQWRPSGRHHPLSRGARGSILVLAICWSQGYYIFFS